MKKNQRLLFGGILAFTMLGILILNLFTPMIADDYRYAFRFDTDTRLTQFSQIMPSLLAHARLINGRLTPHFFVQLFTLLPRFVFIVCNTLIYLLLLMGIYTLCRRTDTRYDWKLLLILDGALFLLPPAFGQSFLWLSGSLNYLWRDALMVWLLIPFADQVFRQPKPIKPLQITLLALGGLFLGNMSENMSAAAALMIGFCSLWLLIQRRKVPGWMILTTITTLCGWLLLMLAPANRLNAGQSLSGGMNALLQNAQAALQMWMNHGLWLTISFSVFLFIAAWSQEAQRDRLAFALGLFLCALLGNFAMIASPYYPERAFSGIVVLLLLANGVAMYACAVDRWHLVVVRSLCFVLTLLMGLEMLYALPSGYNRYQLYKARAAQVQAAKQAGETDITTFGILGNTRFDAFDGLNELTTDPTYFPNVYFAKYYGLDRVVANRFE